MSTRIQFRNRAIAASILPSISTRRLGAILGLSAFILVSACAPAVTPVTSTAELPTPTFIPEIPTATATLVPTEAVVEATAAPTQTVEVQPVATSRGPDLEATDPATVSLTSGGLQLVEFFRFT